MHKFANSRVNLTIPGLKYKSIRLYVCKTNLVDVFFDYGKYGFEYVKTALECPKRHVWK